jgi:hypothetical protein
MYILHNISLGDFGFIPGQQTDSNIALSGHLDMPARTGKTFHKWAVDNYVEPYVSASEIRFGGRDLQLVGFITGLNKSDTLNKSKALIAFIDTFTDLVPLSSKWGTYNVQVKSIPIEFLAENYLKVTINMREPVVDLSGVLPEADGGTYGIDGISFGKLGGFLTEYKGDRRSRPEIQSQSFTAYENEGYQITKTENPVLELSLFVSGSTYEDFKAKIKGLYALFAKPGLRFLNVKDDIIRDFFVTEGFKITKLYNQANRCVGVVNFKAMEIPITYSFDVDSNMDLSVALPNTAIYTFELTDDGRLIMIR